MGSHTFSRPDRPHWSARLEDKKNTAMARLLRTLGYEARIQPYTAYGSRTKVRVLGRVLFAGPGTKPDHFDQPVYDMRSLARRGFRNFMSQIDPHVRVEITVDTAKGAQVFETYADRSGIIDEIIPVELEPGLHEITLSTDGTNTVTANAHVFDDEAQEIAVVSDIDDTVLITLLPRPLIAGWNAFVISQASRRIVPGMPVFYQQLRRHYGENTPFIYVSTGAWNVAPVLERFLFKNGYPAGPLLLTDWGPTNTGFFRSGTRHKFTTLASLREMFPNTRWLLVGDDGQHDPSIYGSIVEDHPESVAAVAIRELTDDEQDLAHGAERPLASIGAFGRALVGAVPKVWRSTIGRNESDARPATVGPPSSGAGRNRSEHAHESVHERHGVPWVSAPDGFGLIRAARAIGILGRHPREGEEKLP
ncbi:DUF2183 domain-containing protein [Dermabacter sp. p3-SID358]|uniref:App1 family protein n=1 Tax=Dermabacter sp. p3-SID358 TaxID=2916114 RepID=UPI0021A30100|nr:phosphatase domain-containing protein [Dermabacter sp. p3-SID358]MCT1867171.1 DUF2183 domain-containing protein [Dermabacter sp. p3-SID358]